MTGLRRIAAITAVSLLAAGAVAWLVRWNRANGADEGGGASAKATSAAQVKRQTLSSRIDVDGTLGYSGSYTAVNQLQGTVTAIAGAGSVVERGQALYSVENRPVVLLHGELPAWRRLGEGIEPGPDVRQLEENLVAVGMATERQLQVDDEFTSATTEAVKRWQKSMNVEQTGTVELGQVVFLPGASRVTEAKIEKGGQATPGMPIVAATGTTRIVTVDLDASKQALVKVGDKVEVKLPSGPTTTGSIAAVGTVAQTRGQNESAKQVVSVTVALDDPASTGTLDQAPVKVSITTATREGVLTVPVNALLALREGGYGVRTAGAPDEGGGRMIPVETGLFFRGSVEVSGPGLVEGLDVEVPAA